MADRAVHRVRVEPLGAQFDAPDDLPLLAAARAAGVILPSACRNGTCRACLCESAAGTVAYRIPWPGLSAEEKTAGCVLPCVAHAASALVLRVPQARFAESA